MPSRFALRLDRNLLPGTAFDGVRLETLLHIPASASIGGGLAAIVGGLIAQVSTSDQVANAGLWAALAGVIASCTALVSTLVKAYFDNKQRAREHELAMQREAGRAELIRKSAMKNREKIRALVRWAHDAKTKYEGLPEPPDIYFDAVDAARTPDPDQLM